MLRKLIALPILSFFLLSGSQAFAQRIELTPFGGYQFWGAYKYGSGKLQFRDGPAYGGTLGFEVQDEMFVNLLFNHQDSYVTDIPYNGISKDLGAVGLNYIMLNAERGVAVSDQVTPFATFGLGAAFMDPAGTGSNAWRFAVDGGLGLKYYASEKVGIKLGVNFWAPMQGAGFGVGFGTGGAYAGASTYTTIVQMSFNGGLILRLK